MKTDVSLSGPAQYFARWRNGARDLSSIPDNTKWVSTENAVLARLEPTLVTAETSSYIPPIGQTLVSQYRCQTSTRHNAPMMATCPGLLSVGTCVCEIPYAPLFSTISLRYGATRSGTPGTICEAFAVKAKSARRPSPDKCKERCQNPFEKQGWILSTDVVAGLAHR